MYAEEGSSYARSHGNGSPVTLRGAAGADASNEGWSNDFLSARLVKGRCFPTLTVTDFCTQPSFAAGRGLLVKRREGRGRAAALTPLRRGAPTAIMGDTRGVHGVRLEFIRRKPVENAFHGSFNGICVTNA
jgi:hypothetical protein